VDRLLAATISIVQCGLGLYLTGRVIPDRRGGSAVTVFEAINRLDGVKMSPALAPAIAISGVGYLFLLNGPALAARVSLPLLLVWVTGVGVVLGRAR
jgi:hypothetical protein